MAARGPNLQVDPVWATIQRNYDGRYSHGHTMNIAVIGMEGTGKSYLQNRLLTLVGVEAGNRTADDVSRFSRSLSSGHDTESISKIQVNGLGLHMLDLPGLFGARWEPTAVVKDGVFSIGDTDKEGMMEMGKLIGKLARGKVKPDSKTVVDSNNCINPNTYWTSEVLHKVNMFLVTISLQPLLKAITAGTRSDEQAELAKVLDSGTTAAARKAALRNFWRVHGKAQLDVVKHELGGHHSTAHALVVYTKLDAIDQYCTSHNLVGRSQEIVATLKAFHTRGDLFVLGGDEDHDDRIPAHYKAEYTALVKRMVTINLDLQKGYGLMCRKEAKRKEGPHAVETTGRVAAGVGAGAGAGAGIALAVAAATPPGLVVTAVAGGVIGVIGGITAGYKWWNRDSNVK